VVKLTESEEWTYFNPTTIKISGDFSSKYWPNQIVVITQGGQTKYFEVVSVEVSSGNTLLQIHGGGLYVLSNEEITNHKYSMYAAPRGLPNNFSRNILSSYISQSLATAANDFLVASGAGSFVKKHLQRQNLFWELGSQVGSMCSTRLQLLQMIS